jgi:hypothetical protein
MKWAVIVFACAVPPACREHSPSRHQAAIGARADAKTAVESDASAVPEHIAVPTPPWPRSGGPACSRYVALSAGRSASCAVCGDDGIVHCWGDGASRLLGGERSTPIARSIDGLSDAVAISARPGYGCALSRRGKVRCWAHPEAIFNGEVALPSSALTVQVGDLHACAMLETREIACWGANDWDQLGTSSAPSARPAIVPRLRAERIAVGANAACAIDTERRVWCWGWNGSGVLGAGDRRRREGPQRIEAFADAVEVATDGSSACAQRANGELWCWGQPDDLEATTPRAGLRARLPVARALVVDGFAVSALGADGGVTEVAGAMRPTVLASLPPARALSRRAGGACAILVTGELRCWGNNWYGFLVLAGAR